MQCWFLKSPTDSQNTQTHLETIPLWSRAATMHQMPPRSPDDMRTHKQRLKRAPIPVDSHTKTHRNNNRPVYVFVPCNCSTLSLPNEPVTPSEPPPTPPEKHKDTCKQGSSHFYTRHLHTKRRVDLFTTFARPP